MDWNTDNKNLKIICKIKNRIIGEKITKPFSHILHIWYLYFSMNDRPADKVNYILDAHSFSEYLQKKSAFWESHFFFIALRTDWLKDERLDKVTYRVAPLLKSITCSLYFMAIFSASSCLFLLVKKLFMVPIKLTSY